MKYKKIMLSLIVISLSSISFGFARFELFNVSKETLTVVFDYAHKAEFKIVEMAPKVITQITYGLMRMIIFKGKKEIKGVRNNELLKTINLPLEGSFILSHVTGQEGARVQTQAMTRIDDDFFHKYLDDTPSWEIKAIGPAGDEASSLALWRKS